MCDRLRIIMILGIIVLSGNVAIAQAPASTDRAIAGDGNLSMFCKFAAPQVKDQALRKILVSDTLKCLIICQVSVSPNGGGQAKAAYHVLHTHERRTRFDKQEISKEDYQVLIKNADQAHRD